MTNLTLEQRARFEAWLQSQPHNAPNIAIETAWTAWQAALQQAQQSACPYILTSDEGTSHCSLAESAQQLGAQAVVDAATVFRISGGDIECFPTPSAQEAMDALRDLRECYDGILPASSQAAAYCDPSDPINSTAFAWPGTDRAERHRDPLFTHPQPPSIPEPSEEDVDVAAAAYDKEADEARKSNANFPQWNALRAALTTYTARLRERIGGLA